MHTVLGANGQIAEELTRELHRSVTDRVRLVSRNPRKVDAEDELVAADLTDADATARAVAGSEVAYLTVGLPMDSALWERQFPRMMANAIAACEQHDCKLVFFDNTYMYPRTSTPHVEDTPFQPVGRKSLVRARIATMLLDEMRAGRIEAVICRAPEFYGPGKTKSITNSFVFDRIRAGKQPRVPLSTRTLRTLIWTPDASRAMARIGDTPDAFGQTWHLPCDPEPITYGRLVDIAAEVTGKRLRARAVPRFVFRLGGLVNASSREVEELLPRYAVDTIFDSSKFRSRFPDFPVTSYREGVTELLGDDPSADAESLRGVGLGV